MSDEVDRWLAKVETLLKSAKEAYNRHSFRYSDHVIKKLHNIIDEINDSKYGSEFTIEKLPLEYYDAEKYLLRAISDLREIRAFLRSVSGKKEETIKVLKNKIEDLKEENESLEEKNEKLLEIMNQQEITPLDKIEKIFNNFHKIAKKLENRYNDRETIEIDDEHDVQDLLEALLLLEFSDIRSEEPVPSDAGGGSNIDFLLKNYEIGIEIKHTTSDDDRKIGEELTTDIEKYKQHPNVEKLICFIYNPRHTLRNPEGLKKDLNNKSDDDLPIHTYIKPD